jgi:hypothetical protein
MSSLTTAGSRFTPGDPAATRGAVLQLVDSPTPPQRMFLVEAPLRIATADYASRLANWLEWQPVSEAAQSQTNPGRPVTDSG